MREVSKGLALGKGFVDEGKVVSCAYIPAHTCVLWTVVNLTKASVDDDWNGRVAEQDLARCFLTSYGRHI